MFIDCGRRLVRLPLFLFIKVGEKVANRSVIGDYVHYNQINYINFGINKKGETPSEDWNSAYNILKEKIQK